MTAAAPSTPREPEALRRPSGWTAALAPAGVVAIGALLRLIDFQRVRLDPYYDAAVRSMGQSWRNLFYGAYEPAAQVAVDKTPADLWLQVASTKLFGFDSVALRLPEVVAGILAMVVLYDLVRRLFGARAGLASAAALAVLPISVVTSRSDTMDSLMMLCVLVAAWLVVGAARTRRQAPLVAAGAVMGIAFNVKLFEALIALPALLALALLIGEGPWRRRAAGLGASALAFGAVSSAWLVAVSLSPAARRPFPIGSSDGSVWDVVVQFNGIDRIGARPSSAQALLDPAGPQRLFTTTGVLHGRLVGSALVAALALGAAMLATLAWHRRHDPAEPPAPAGVRRTQRAGAVFLAVWLVVGCGLFSAMGRLHPRYLEAFTPAIAATTGVGLAWLAERAHRDAAARWLLVAAVAVTAALAPAVAARTWPGAAVVSASAAAVTALLALAIRRRSWPAQATLLGAAAVTVLVVPAAGSLHLVATGASSSGRVADAAPRRVAALSRYLEAHQGAARYETASSAVAKAAPLIARDGRPVLMLTSLHDRPLLTAAQLAAYVARGDVRYILLRRERCIRGSARCPPVIRWARRHTVDVSRAAHQGKGSLYRLTSAPREIGGRAHGHRARALTRRQRPRHKRQR